MPYITTAEKIGIEKGKKEAIEEMLETRFGALPKRLMGKIQEIKGDKLLSALHKKAILVIKVGSGLELSVFLMKALKSLHT